MADIRPIETTYNGFKFRSRLEARWAVFFDRAGVKFEYELEGFELGGGVRYLPDFWLPEIGVYVETKPSTQLSGVDIEKIVRFAADGDKRLLLIVGTPTSEQMYLLDRKCLESWSYFTEEYSHDEALLRGIFWEGIQEWAHVQFGNLPLQEGLTLVYRTVPPVSEAWITHALVTAKQARFEHGRRGN